ncbi:MAG: diacylglycerol kinase family protein [Candidatus Buchananbacteria bacterium]
MYLYLYDSFLNNKKYNSLLARIETRLTDLGIGGKIYRLSPLRNVNDLLADEVKHGIKTVIVVGDDKTFTQIINAVAKLDIILGFIPVGNENKIAQMLGIGSPDQACETIAARIVEKVDLGQANGTFFLSNITVSAGDVTIECENNYRIKPQGNDQVCICNLRPILANAQNQTNYFNPQDGHLEILIQPITSWFENAFKKSAQLKKSIIPFKKIAIKSKTSLSVITDGQRVLKTPVEVEIATEKLKIIVGKKRMF